MSGIAVVALAVAACGPLFRHYEYQEDITLSLDGRARIDVSTSLAALVALRGVDLDTRPAARFDAGRVREIFSSPVTRVTRVTSSRRLGRRFAHVRIEVDDIRQVGSAPVFAWAAYSLSRAGDQVLYRQQIGTAANHPAEHVRWTGGEIVAFRLHLPSRILAHNAPSRTVERGNIVSWEQPLAERLAGRPLVIEVRMASTSILYSTLVLFAASAMAAVLVLGGIIWWVVRRPSPTASARATSSRPPRD